jgi:hypothetical protein
MEQKRYIKNNKRRKQNMENKPLPKLQKNIILDLAKNDPQSIYRTSKNITTCYCPTYKAFKILQRKGCIKELTLKEHHRKKHSYFWITYLGIIIALAEGANIANLLRKTRKYYPENTELQFIIATSFIFGTDTLKAIYLKFLNKGKLERNDIATIIAIQMQRKLTPDENKRLTTILNKFHEQRQQILEIMNQIQENINQVKHKLT